MRVHRPSNRCENLIGPALIALVAISAILSVIAIRRHRPLCWDFLTEAATLSKSEPQFETVLDFAPSSGIAHSPAIMSQPVGFRVLWFQGSNEAVPDVRIMSSDIAYGPEGWRASQPEPFITSPELGQVFQPAQLVVTLGNMVQNPARPDSVFTTVVSVGGWAMASIAEVILANGRIATASKLNLSPLLNRSHLVKSPTNAYTDGSHALPAYFEMGSAHSVLVRTDQEGRVADRRLMRGKGLKPIQPMIVALDQNRAIAYLRQFGGGEPVLISRTDDGGQSWSSVERSGIPNADGPVAALPLADGRLLMAMNDLPDEPNVLRLTVSDDLGQTRSLVRLFGDANEATRYPLLQRLPSGEIVLTYSTNSSKGIHAHVFNDAWVSMQ